MTHRILFVSKGLQASSTRYRYSDFVPYWEAKGWEVSHVRHDSSLRCWLDILRSARGVDVVVVMRRTFNFPLLNLLRAAAPHLVFDFDDAIFVRGSGEGSPSKLARFARTVSACDQVWAGNPYLASKAAEFNDRVSVIPTAVDAAKYQISPPKPDNRIDLVWIGSAATRKHLMTVLPALEQATDRVKNLRLKVIADFDVESDRLDTESIRWSAEKEAEAVASAHIGVAPLPDNPFTRGKCGLKILQYMAAGLPVIASPVGVNADLVQDGVTGYTARSEDEWIDTVVRLAGDRDLCGRLGESGRQLCLRDYTLKSVFQRLSDSLDDLDD